MIALAVSMVAAWVPPELENCTTPEEFYEVCANTNSKSLLDVLPIQLQGPNLTLSNFQKWFDFTITTGGPGMKTKTIKPVPAHSANFSANVDVNPADMVNVFKDVWDWVKDNVAQINIGRGNFAGATPSGLSWTEVTFPYEPEHWGTKDSVFWMHWHNGFGVQNAVIDWGWQWYCNGAWSTGGHYMNQATQLIFKADAGFAVTLNANSHASPPVNVGSTSNPNPAITFNLNANANGGYVYETFILRGDCSGQRVSFSEDADLLV